MRNFKMFLVFVVLSFTGQDVFAAGNEFLKDLGRQLAVDYARTAVVREAENSSDARYGNPRQPQTIVNVQPQGGSGQQGGQGYYSGATIDGAHYEGEISNYVPHGFGVYTWTDGKKYSGEWSNNKRTGQGTYTWPNGQKYIGEFRDDSYSGQGTLTFSDGRKYIGEFKDDKKSGHGTFTWVDGRKYVGKWRNGKKSGQGTFTLPSGLKHIGEWRDGKRNGHGTDTLGNGTFVGEYRDGRTYEGTFTGKDGTIISGVFGDIKSGDITYPDGRKYSGEWNGSAKFLGVEVPPGSWTYERPHGFGKMAYPDGTVKIGMWWKGEFVDR